MSSVALQTVPAGRHRSTTALVVRFDEALDANAARSLGAYTLTTLPQGKTHRSKLITLAQSSYDPLTHTVTLTPRKKLPAGTTLQLRIHAAALTDALGRPLDGNRDGQPGGDFVATVSKGGVSLSSVDALIASGFRPGVRHSGK